MDSFDRLRGEEYLSDWPRYSAQDLRRKQGTVAAARLALNAALTAPVAGGVPQIEAQLVYGQEELEKVARKMEELGHKNETLKKRFLYEAVMVRESDVILFLGNYRAHETPLDANCGLCGGAQGCGFFYERRENSNGLVDITDRSSNTPIKGPLCAARVGDLGYAMASAVWMAQTLMVDARPFMSIGLAGQELGYCRNAAITVGIPMATLSKNPYQDINTDYHLINSEKVVDSARKNFVVNRQTSSGMNFDYRTQHPKSEKGDDNG
jgi:uncharacterized ferredoxin-like protein